MPLVLPHNPSPVVQHHMEGRRVILVDPKVDLLLRDNIFCSLQGKLQAGGSVAFPPLLFPDAVADMPRAVPERFCQVVPDPEFPPIRRPSSHR